MIFLCGISKLLSQGDPAHKTSSPSSSSCPATLSWTFGPVTGHLWDVLLGTLDSESPAGSIPPAPTCNPPSFSPLQLRRMVLSSLQAPRSLQDHPVCSPSSVWAFPSQTLSCPVPTSPNITAEFSSPPFPPGGSHHPLCSYGLVSLAILQG
jgi:hypothetical protein